MHAALGPCDFIFERRSVRGQGLVWAFRNGRDPAEHRCPRPCLQILLMPAPGSRKCTWVSIHARQNMKPVTLMVSPRWRARRSPISAIFPSVIRCHARSTARMVGDRTALQDRVEASRHCWIPYKKLACALLTIFLSRVRLSTKRRGRSRGFAGFARVLDERQVSLLGDRGVSIGGRRHDRFSSKAHHQ